jgi:hypothetical protein
MSIKRKRKQTLSWLSSTMLQAWLWECVRIDKLLEYGSTRLLLSFPFFRKSLVQYIHRNMAEVRPPQFWNQNNSYFSSIFHEVTQPQPKIYHKQVYGLKILIPREHKIADGDLLHTIKSCHTYKTKNIHLSISVTI